LLKKIVELIHARGWRVVNADITVIAQQPRLAGFVVQMAGRIAAVLEVDPACVNVKAKTNEKLGYLGRGEAIEAQAVVLLAP
jgi:2-C-methyl-D-erythritol 2,4-cyclodiphosphate synthase